MLLLICLLVLISIAAVAQLVIASGSGPAFPGPASPGELPSTAASPTT
jgi:hypothetical protein